MSVCEGSESWASVTAASQRARECVGNVRDFTCTCAHVQVNTYVSCQRAEQKEPAALSMVTRGYRYPK